MISKIKLFDKEIPVRTHFCQFFNNDPQPIPEPHVNIYVRTKFCNAKCKFCIWADDAQIFNEKKYIESLKEIKNNIRIKKISFTGGEPTMNFKRFKRMVEIASDICPDTSLTMNTDGLRLRQLFEDPVIELLDYVSLSRHHFDDNLNNEIFDFECPSTEEIKDIQSNNPRKNIFHLTCNLIDGYIDSKDKVYQFLEFASELGIESVGFNSLMPVNEYSKEKFVDFNIKDLINERFKLTKEWKYKDMCKCNNYVYFPESMENMISVYHKNTYNPFDIYENLVFDGENLKAGFSGEEIIY